MAATAATKSHVSRDFFERCRAESSTSCPLDLPPITRGADSPLEKSHNNVILDPAACLSGLSPTCLRRRFDCNGDGDRDASAHAETDGVPRSSCTQTEKTCEDVQVVCGAEIVPVPDRAMCFA
jgi:hypothetical protein